MYLHDQGLIHRDIKDANILTKRDGFVKLADFGVAAITTTAARNDVVVRSLHWSKLRGFDLLVHRLSHLQWNLRL